MTFDAIRAQLEGELEAVEAQLKDHGATPTGDIQSTGHEGFADSAAATAERSELLSLVDQLASRRTDIVAALTRIDEGTYGKCERCGQAIPVERLEALPTARLCVSCVEAA